MKEQHRTAREAVAVLAAGVFLACSTAAASHSAAPKPEIPEPERPPVSSPAPVSEQQPPHADTSAPPSHSDQLIIKEKYDLTTQETEDLLRIAMAEAGGESMEGKALVMKVILNRVQDERFPDNVHAVIFQTLMGRYQFTPVKEGGSFWTVTPSEDCRIALDLVQTGWDESQGALYFDNRGSGTWQARNCQYLFQYGGHYFYK